VDVTAEGSAPRSSPFHRLWDSAWRFGIAVPIILGFVLIAFIAIQLTTGRGFPDPEARPAGDVDSYITGLPKYYEIEHFWTVVGEDGEAIALSDKDPTTRCVVLWYDDITYMGKTGWFKEACNDGLYDYTGRCFTGDCIRNLDRYRTTIQDGEVTVNLKLWSQGGVPDKDAEPLNPPSLND
jgi:hypothetical protein